MKRDSAEFYLITILVIERGLVSAMCCLAHRREVGFQSHSSVNEVDGVCNGDVTLAPGWANAGRGHADSHVQRMPCSEIVQQQEDM